MKKIVFDLGILLFAVTLFSACGNSNSKKESSSSVKTEKTEKQKKSNSSSTSTTETISKAIEESSTIENQEQQTTAQTQQQDFDIEAINNGDLTTLVGTWQNGNGDILVINADGTTNDGQKVSGVKDSDKTSKIPYAAISDGQIGAAVGLYKIGFKNPDGDYSDTTKPRLTIAQQGGAYPAEIYYYRQ